MATRQIKVKGRYFHYIDFNNNARWIRGTLVAGTGGADRTILFSVAGTLVVGNNVSFEIPVPVAMTILTVYINVKTAPTGAAIIVNVRKNGTAIFPDDATRPTIAINGTADESGTPSTTTLAKNDIVSADIVQIGSTIAGADLTVEVRCEVT